MEDEKKLVWVRCWWWWWWWQKFHFSCRFVRFGAHYIACTTVHCSSAWLFSFFFSYLLHVQFFSLVFFPGCEWKSIKVYGAVVYGNQVDGDRRVAFSINFLFYCVKVAEVKTVWFLSFGSCAPCTHTHTFAQTAENCNGLDSIWTSLKFHYSFATRLHAKFKQLGEYFRSCTRYAHCSLQCANPIFPNFFFVFYFRFNKMQI